WWSYRNNDWRKSNRGRRLDHILASPALAAAIRSHGIDVDARGWKKASDHVPVMATFEV
ncbi:MAG: exodeoxyribonuclease III, partial [Alphaproteobacteria bacterium]|nr:exodeoxyribonuclease III [Alphaproteobacteria bacterium]